jgi:gamma-glutamylaminecyclotransferase
MKKPIEKTPYLFVYGTLMRGFGNNTILKSSQFIDSASTEEEYKLVADVIPFLVDEPRGYVHGELYKVNEHVLEIIDQLENHPNWYERRVINVISEVGDKYSAWTYFIHERHIPKTHDTVESGIYRDYTTEYLKEKAY